MSAQRVTPELREWIVAQATAGHPPDAVLKSMLASGWQEGVAITALEETLREHLNDHARTSGLPPPRIVPEPLAGLEGATLHPDEHEVRVLVAMRNPRVIV